MFRNKGRIKVGADADITVFDPATVADMSTYQQPALLSFGFRHVLVNGIPVVVDGVIRDSVYPGSEARSPARIDRQGDGKPGVRGRARIRGHGGPSR